MDSNRLWRLVGISSLALLRVAIAVPIGTLAWLFLARGDLIAAALFGSSTGVPIVGFFPYSAGPIGLVVALLLAQPSSKKASWSVAPATVVLIGAISLLFEGRLRFTNVFEARDIGFLVATSVTTVWASTFIALQLALVAKCWHIFAIFLGLAALFAIAIVLAAGGSPLEIALWSLVGATALVVAVIRRADFRQQR